MGRMHRPGDEKRMPVIVPPGRYADWLDASPQQAMEFTRCFPAQEMRGEPAPLERDTKTPRAVPRSDSPPPPENLSLF